MRFASVVIVAFRVESLFGNAVAALEREEREVEFWFQMVDLGGSTAHFCFATRMVMVRVQVGGLGELLKFEIRYFQYPLYNA